MGSMCGQFDRRKWMEGWEDCWMEGCMEGWVKSVQRKRRIDGELGRRLNGETCGGIDTKMGGR